MPKNFPKQRKKAKGFVSNELKKGKNFQPKKFKTKGCPNCILGVVQQRGTDWSKLLTASKAEEEELEGACLRKFGRKKVTIIFQTGRE